MRYCTAVDNLTLAYTYLTNLASVLVTDLNLVGSATGARGTELYTLIIFRVDTHKIILVTLSDILIGHLTSSQNESGLSK
jgi:hypothetical protein